MKKFIKSVFCLLFSLLIIISVFAFVPVAAESTEGSLDIGIGEASDFNYLTYKNANSEKGYATESIDIDAFALLSSSNAETANGLVVLKENKNTAKFRFNTNQEALYNLKLVYYPQVTGTSDIKIGVKIDGEYPFSEAENISCHRNWKDSSDEWRTDSKGNEFTSEQIQADNAVECTLFDNDGIYIYPFEFYLSKGTHEIEILLLEEGLSIEKLSFVPPERLSSYEEIKQSYISNGYTKYDGDPLILEAENSMLKTSNSLTAKSDSNSIDVSPNSTTTSVVNYIGGENWRSPGDEITWKIHISKSGLYKLGFSYKQVYVMNGSVYRWLKIDGKTPFSEASSIDFAYNSGWKKKVFANNSDEPYLIYLDKGEHTVSMSVTLGVMADFYRRLSNIVSILGQQYLNISMITGESPDPNRDYELFKQIPELKEVLTTQESELLALADELEAASGSKTTQYTSVLKSMAQIIKQMLAQNYLAHTYISEYYSKYVSLSASLSELQDMSLALDKIYITSPDEDIEKADHNPFEWMSFHIKRFIYSFTEDYSSPKSKGEKSIKLWINWGNDQAQVLSSLIQESFTPNTGIEVQFELVNTSIIQGILTNNQPDIVLHMDRSTPVNYAMRGALYPLNNFNDFNEVLNRFADGAEVPYIYNGNCYALPDTQNFYVMFYRSDVLKQLDVEVPETWEEFGEVLAIIQRNNMNAYFPYVKPTGITGSIGQLNLFATLLTQNNLQVYNSSRNANLLGEKDAINVFEEYTKFYTDYKIPVTADFYNRFRLGVTPLGIASYTQYNTLKAAATEIDGKWGIAPIPGTVQEDGTINISQCGSGSGCCILNKSDNKDEAWEFLKWWTSAEIQTRYSQNLESILGPTARIATSTVEALGNYSWNAGDREILFKQWENVVEIPELPGSYHLARSLDQAFLEVVNGKSTPNDAMVKWSKSANNEIQRKIAEYQ